MCRRRCRALRSPRALLAVYYKRRSLFVDASPSLDVSSRERRRIVPHVLPRNIFERDVHSLSIDPELCQQLAQILAQLSVILQVYRPERRHPTQRARIARPSPYHIQLIHRAHRDVTLRFLQRLRDRARRREQECPLLIPHRHIRVHHERRISRQSTQIAPNRPRARRSSSSSPARARARSPSRARARRPHSRARPSRSIARPIARSVVFERHGRDRKVIATDETRSRRSTVVHRPSKSRRER